MERKLDVGLELPKSECWIEIVKYVSGVFEFISALLRAHL